MGIYNDRKKAAPVPVPQAEQLNSSPDLSAPVKTTVPIQSLFHVPAEPVNALGQSRNETGLPDSLKAGVENLSGYSLDNVRVHYNSNKPAQLQAHAYAQGTDIHLAPGQEQHLPHEAWHVVQQMQSRVKATGELKNGVPVNDDLALEREASTKGAEAISYVSKPHAKKEGNSDTQIVQRAINGHERLDDVDDELRKYYRGLSDEKQALFLEWLGDGVNHTITPPSASAAASSNGNGTEWHWETQKMGNLDESGKPAHLKENLASSPAPVSAASASEIANKSDHQHGDTITDLNFPGLEFRINKVLSEQYEIACFDVVGTGLQNPTTVYKEGNGYCDVENGEDWTPKTAENPDRLAIQLERKLDAIAERNYGKNCHIVATEMQDAFRSEKTPSEVIEIYATAGGNDAAARIRIDVMGSSVRNHYVNRVNGRVYDSSTKSKGTPWEVYISALQASQTQSQILQSRQAEPGE